MDPALPKIISDYLVQLVRTKKARAPIFYNDLAAALGLPPVTEAWRSHPFCEAFGFLDEEDERLKKPLRTSLVISRELNMPGEGFFFTLQRIRGVRIPRDPQKRMQIYLKELGDALSYYAKNA